MSDRANGKVDAIDTPIGFIPKYEDLKKLFADCIDKEYPKALYNKHFSLYIDKILSRIDLQREAFGKEKNLPPKLFEIYSEWEKDLNVLKAKFGSIVTPDQLLG